MISTMRKRVVKQLSSEDAADMQLRTTRANRAARGWQVILQTEPEKSLAAMKALGLPVGRS